MIIIGVDQSLVKSAMCVTVNGTYKTHSIAYTTKEMGDTHARIKIIIDRLLEMCKTHNPNIVAIESLAFSANGAATRDLAMLLGAICYALTTNNIAYTTTPPTTIKKSFTNDGTASKQKMFDHLPNDVQQRFASVSITNGRFDLTDSYAIATHEWKKHNAT